MRYPATTKTLPKKKQPFRHAKMTPSGPLPSKQCPIVAYLERTTMSFVVYVAGHNGVIHVGICGNVCYIVVANAHCNFPLRELISSNCRRHKPMPRRKTVLHTVLRKTDDTPPLAICREALTSPSRRFTLATSVHIPTLSMAYQPIPNDACLPGDDPILRISEGAPGLLSELLESLYEPPDRNTSAVYRTPRRRRNRP